METTTFGGRVSEADTPLGFAGRAQNALESRLNGLDSKILMMVGKPSTLDFDTL